MSLLRPDPTFYPSPKMAMQAPPERLAYVALINPTKKGRSDAIGVVDQRFLVRDGYFGIGSGGMTLPSARERDVTMASANTAAR